MRNDVLGSSFHHVGKPADRPSGIGNKIAVATLFIGTLLAGVMEMISGSPNKPRNAEDARVTFVKKFEAIFNFKNESVEEYLASDRVANSPTLRVDKLLSELTITLADLIASYNEYTQAVEAGDGSLADKERKLHVALFKAASGILNGANINRNDPRAPLALARCEKSLRALEILRPMLPVSCTNEIADLSREYIAIRRFRAEVDTEENIEEPHPSQEVGMLDSSSGSSAQSVIDDFFRTHSQKESDTDALSYADLSPAGGG